MVSKGKAAVVETEDRDKELLLSWARTTLADPDATAIDKGRASDTLMRVTGLAMKPADPRPLHDDITEATARCIADQAERFLGNCPHCGGKL